MTQLAGTILVVDDNAALAENLAEILGDVGYRAAVADSAEAALDTIGRGDVAALITDYRLPGLNGAQLISEIRRRGINIPAVVISAHTDPKTIALARSAGALDVLAKPINIGHLISVVEDLGNDGTTVLLVEDNAVLAENLSEVLRLAGYQVVLGTSVADVLSRPGRPRVAIVDYHLPDGSGVDLAQLLTARDPRVQILFVSGYHDDLLKQLKGPLTDAAHMDKPLDLSRLLAWVAGAVSHGQTARSGR